MTDSTNNDETTAVMRAALGAAAEITLGDSDPDVIAAFAETVPAHRREAFNLLVATFRDNFKLHGPEYLRRQGLATARREAGLP
ncbi:hypothetical protein [Micromonospora coerulea]|uniref:hypothetical protein n=1 Tax=Micromonospora coerulea TaxID=47856 RepID=UPI001904A9AF|nr:hypothetical protein [Micromonospora veneta]